jgi:hypothetical protein
LNIKQKSDFEFSYHVSQLSRLLYSGETSKIKSYILGLDDDTQGRLGPWLTHVLGNEYPSFSVAGQKPHNELAGSANVWRAYYRNDYLAAHEQFTQCHQLKPKKSSMTF